MEQLKAGQGEIAFTFINLNASVHIMILVLLQNGKTTLKISKM